MRLRTEQRAYIDEAGRLVLPPDMVARLGLVPGTPVFLDEEARGLRLRQPITRLAKVYVEPTSRCNLACRTCIRNVWDEPLGSIAENTFTRILDGLRAFPLPLTVFFGGFGEPLSHPRILDMIEAAKALGASVELITNGTLLNETMARGLIAAGLDRLWVSLDGAKPESYTDVRLGATLPVVLANLERFRDLRQPWRHLAPEIGIAFVAMQRNVGDLPGLLSIARQLGAARMMISNVLPHTAEMREEILYHRALSNDDYLPSPRLPDLYLPRMDSARLATPALYEAVAGAWNLVYAGDDGDGDSASSRCPFIESGATAIAWDGSVSPCLPLLHSSDSFLHGLGRYARRCVIGSIHEHSLEELWQQPEYVAFRERVQAFDFAPCTVCDGCALSEDNEADCYGSEFPTCGGCLWAQGIVQCP